MILAVVHTIFNVDLSVCVSSVRFTVTVSKPSRLAMYDMKRGNVQAMSMVNAKMRKNDVGGTLLSDNTLTIQRIAKDT